MRKYIKFIYRYQIKETGESLIVFFNFFFMYIQYLEQKMAKGKVQMSNYKIKFQCRHQFYPLTREQFNTAKNPKEVEFYAKNK